jgi:Ca2+-binding RTX toxin-like protein
MASFTVSAVESGDKFLENNDLGKVELGAQLNGSVGMTDSGLLQVDGTVSSSFNAVSIEGADSDVIIQNFATGRITGDATAISSEDVVGAEIINSGIIEGSSNGIDLAYRAGNWRTDNFGEIRGGVVGFAIGASEMGAEVQLNNSGLVFGDWGLTCMATLQLSNFGTIEATNGIDGIKWAIVTFGFNDYVGNSGSILGRVDLEHGDNTFDGSAGIQSWVRTGNGKDTIFGGSKAEVLTSLGGTDVITGGGGNDTISGGGDFDTLFGDGGNDKITGGGGSDGLVGGDGKDTFIFKPGHGADVINDFAASGGNHDILDLRNIPAIKNFADFMKSHAVQSGDDVLITGQTGDSITLVDVNLRALDRGDVLI